MGFGLVGGGAIGQTAQQSAAGNARAEAEGQLNAQQQEKMQETSAKFETAAKMSKFAFDLGKTIRGMWP